jgi:hypothetical protein
MKKLSIIVLLFIVNSTAQASHLLGGDIRVQKIDNQTLQYQITATIYFDGVAGLGAIDAEKTISLCIGSGQTISVPRLSLTAFDQNIKIAVGIYQTTYTYNSAGRYTVSVSLNNRSVGILNLPTGVDMPFFIQTTFEATPQNTTPQLLSGIGAVAGGVNQVFKYTLNAKDNEGDSLVYRLARSQTGAVGQCGGSIIDRYRFPNEVTKEGTFVINSKTGILTWNVPRQTGLYAIAILVEEWRNSQKISETLRDMVILIEDKAATNMPIIPVFEIPTEYTFILGTTDNQTDEELTVFPVPATDGCTLVFRSTKPTTPIFQVIDIQGNILQEIKTNTPQTQHEHFVKMQSLPTGTYFIRCITNKTITRQLVRE